MGHPASNGSVTEKTSHSQLLGRIHYCFRPNCSMASVELLFSLDQPASVQQGLWNMPLYSMRCCSSHGQTNVTQPSFPRPGATAGCAQLWGTNKLNSGSQLGLAAGLWGWNPQGFSYSLLLLLHGGVALVLVPHPISHLQPWLVWCVPEQAVVRFTSSNLRHKQCGCLCLSHAFRGGGGRRTLVGHSWAHPKSDHLKCPFLSSTAERLCNQLSQPFTLWVDVCGCISPVLPPAPPFVSFWLDKKPK